mgnify:CR=1 FL=1
MNREVHVPFCEGLPVKFRRSTHQPVDNFYGDVFVTEYDLKYKYQR